MARRLLTIKSLCNSACTVFFAALPTRKLFRYTKSAKPLSTLPSARMGFKVSDLPKGPPHAIAKALGAQAAERIFDLDDHNEYVRWDAMALLLELPPEILAVHMRRLVPMLEDKSSNVRASTVQALAMLLPEDLCVIGPDIARRTEHTRPDVRIAAIHALEQLPPDVLCEYAGALVALLADRDHLVIEQATKTLRSLPYATILQHKEAVLETLGPANDGVWRAASGVSVLELCDASARKAALALLGMVPGDHLARECANEIVSRLEDAPIALRRLAWEYFGRDVLLVAIDACDRYPPWLLPPTRIVRLLSLSDELMAAEYEVAFERAASIGHWILVQTLCDALAPPDQTEPRPGSPSASPVRSPSPASFLRAPPSRRRALSPPLTQDWHRPRESTPLAPVPPAGRAPPATPELAALRSKWRRTLEEQAAKEREACLNTPGTSLVVLCTRAAVPTHRESDGAPVEGYDGLTPLEVADLIKAHVTKLSERCPRRILVFNPLRDLPGLNGGHVLPLEGKRAAAPAGRGDGDDGSLLAASLRSLGDGATDGPPTRAAASSAEEVLEQEEEAARHGVCLVVWRQMLARAYKTGGCVLRLELDEAGLSPNQEAESGMAEDKEVRWGRRRHPMQRPVGARMRSRSGGLRARLTPPWHPAHGARVVQAGAGRADRVEPAHGVREPRAQPHPGGGWARAAGGDLPGCEPCDQAAAGGQGGRAGAGEAAQSHSISRAAPERACTLHRACASLRSCLPLPPRTPPHPAPTHACRSTERALLQVIAAKEKAAEREISNLKEELEALRAAGFGGAAATPPRRPRASRG